MPPKAAYASYFAETKLCLQLQNKEGLLKLKSSGLSGLGLFASQIQVN